MYTIYSVAEPDLDVSVSDEDKEECLQQVQILCNHINEVEKRLDPQPLPTIPLPTALEEFSWVALGHTLRDLHNYITDNHMVCAILLFFLKFKSQLSSFVNAV